MSNTMKAANTFSRDSEITMAAYEIEREREVKANRERHARLSGLIASIVIPDFAFVCPQSEQPTFGHFTGPNNAKIAFRTLWNDKERLHIFGCDVRDSQGNSHTDYGEHLPSINVSSSKTAEQISKDIARRLLPDYLAFLAKINARIAATETYLSSKSLNGARIKAAFPELELVDTIKGERYGNPMNGSDVSLYSVGEPYHAIKVKINEKSIDLTLNGLSVERAIQILSAAKSLPEFGKGK